MSRPSTIFVYADWKGLGGATLMGQLHRSTVRGEEVLSSAAAWASTSVFPKCGSNQL